MQSRHHFQKHLPIILIFALILVYEDCLLAQLKKKKPPSPLDDDPTFDFPDFQEDFVDANDTRTPILISYLGAVSEFSPGLFEKLFAKSENTGISDATVQDSQCFRTDFAGSMVSGALLVAIEDINKNPEILPDYKLTYIYNNTCGDEIKGTEYFMEHWKAGAKVFIGLEMSCITEATMAAAQNLPIISHKCNDQRVSDKKKYPTFARTVPAETKITQSFIALLKHFKWKKFSVIYEQQASNIELLSAIKRALDMANSELKYEKNPERYLIINASHVKYPFSDVESSDVLTLQQIITETHKINRLYVTFGNVRLFRMILLQMGELGLMTNGEYMLIYLDTNYNWLNVYHAMNNHFIRDTLVEVSQSWDSSNSVDFKVANYSRSALAIIPTPVKLDYPTLSDFWRRASLYLPRFGIRRHETVSSVKANRFACYLYDAVMLYAQSLHEFMMSNKSLTFDEVTSNGAEIINRILKRRYASIQGFDMQIDENGDALGNYTLLSLQPISPMTNKSNPEYYPLDIALYPTADFVMSGDPSALPQLRFQRKINWIGGTPPVDEPACGFFEEKCGSNNVGLAMLIIFPLILVLAPILIFLYVRHRNLKFEKELSNIWLIDPQEVGKIARCDGSSSTLFVVEDDFMQNEVNNDGCGFRGVAKYKGITVAMKEVRFSSRKPKELTRETKLEMKTMKELRNDNVNNFMGIIQFPNKIIIIREFCAKMSLMNVLNNEDIKLDELFIQSFIEDLLKGMIYLHESLIKVHGNLKSTNCLITSRWVLQISDFGLAEILEGQEESNVLIFEDFIWTAPELLRLYFPRRAFRGTAKGDVYSFSIILHEMVGRQGPFQSASNDSFQNEELLRRVMYENFRPNIVDLSCQNYIVDCMIACWNENPDLRPDFQKGVRHKLRPMFSSKRNIMDHIMVKMEMYQNQLENLVDVRTTELLEEKSRTEILLRRMLPQSVATQLVEMKKVIPESFQSVTIYFSDIVGFTTISSESTPLEVVQFLNKLYTLFDFVINLYDVYKVETIGDAYMVVSGVPMENQKSELFHAEQIALMGLHLLSAVESFRIPHRPDESVKLRIGIHTGPVVAGVVGKTMPRYCLFGDTVNVASRMESTGEALKIHCSAKTANILHSSSQNFVIEPRETINIKGKGPMETFWLNCCEGRQFFIDLEALEHEEPELFPPAVPRIILKNRPNSLLNIRKGSSVSLHSRDREQKSIFHRFIKKAASKSHFIGSQTPNTYKKPMNYRQLVAADNYTRKTSAKLPDLFCVDMDDHHKDFSHPFIVDMEDGLLPPSMVEHSLYKPFISVQNSNDSQSFYNHHNEEIEIHKDIGSGLIFNSHDAKNASMVSRKRSSSDADITLLANYANSHLKERIIDENIKSPLISKRWNELPEKPPRLACSALSKSDNVCWELLSTLGNPISVIPSRKRSVSCEEYSKSKSSAAGGSHSFLGSSNTMVSRVAGEGNDVREIELSPPHVMAMKRRSKWRGTSQDDGFYKNRRPTPLDPENLLEKLPFTHRSRSPGRSDRDVKRLCLQLERNRLESAAAKVRPILMKPREPPRRHSRRPLNRKSLDHLLEDDDTN